MAFNLYSLESKTILVTGASAGIGREIAVLCAKMGAQVIINGRKRERLKETLELLEGDGHMVVAGDLTLPEERDALVEALPLLDGVVHCAGIGHRLLCKSIAESDVDLVMGINFKGPIMLQSSLLKNKRINKSASIVFITSMASQSPSYGNALYSASKGALISYANCLGLELASRQIRVNCISPAMVRTELILRDGISEEQLLEDEKKYPLKRYGQPEDVAALAIYLLSDASSWMTGSDLKITGGAR
ncbi:SDR family oxidoreductase [Prevotella melaninogenica]|uniref:SDR family NAD(P)-dependent oxidoreductase n=1 Tax=Prevotella TaxID=838 RepID=UPI0003AD1C96|nr:MULTISPECIES: SDR family oxidoreductase [Prevotella]ERJ78398.1 oxidoreductase, short chain dehydrogenase/reductase family protein [Prevotella sp. F0091]QUB73509.1 SDR family oxidoreductase [Prevotella melaninogenica]